MTIGHVFRRNISAVLQRTRWLKKQSYSSVAVDQKISYKVDNTLLNYSIKEVEKISELNLTAILLEHKTTGAEHLHLACADSNNLFAVGFRTPPPDSSGVPHILEHLSLCGSQNFPCRDPFFNMLNRSLSTFMNAFTGSDITIYAFSSQNFKDFQNLLSVYLDATFFPLLLEKDFRQEGWRLEHEHINDKNSPIVLKGVVFNEMKGVFSDPAQYYARHLQNFLFPSNAYSYESGGDPLFIPHLTWQNLKHFHSTLYHPSNSRFITYGNMPLEAHLEKIESHVLQNFQKVKVENEILDVESWTKPKEVLIHNRFDPMVAVPENQTVISDSYVLHRITDTHENFALSILGTLLVDGPNSPFYQKLLQAGIGPDYSPCTGFDSSLKQSIFSVGLREIAEKDVELVKNLIPSIFEDVIKKGFPKEQIQSVLHKIELSTKHRTSNFGLNCALGVSSMWNHNGHPISAFKVNDHVQWFLNRLKDNPHFLQDKVVQYFQNNLHKLTLIMKPSEHFESEQEAKEKELLSSKLSRLSDIEKHQIYQQGLELAEHQKCIDASCLPTLLIDDVKRSIETNQLEFTSFSNIPIQVCKQPTNEVTYFRALVDASELSEEEIMLLPLFTSIITQMGAGERNYKELDQEIQLKTGRLDVSLHLSEHPSNPTEYRQALLLSSYCLDKNIKDTFSLWKDILTDVQLKDNERFTQLIRLSATEMAQSITHHGHVYSMRRACSSLSHCAHIREKTSGLSQVTFMKQLAEMESHEELLEQMRKLANVLFCRAPMRCSLNATPNFMPQAMNSLDSFLSELQFSKTSRIQKSKMANYQVKAQRTHFVLPLSVNYLGQSVLTVPYCHPDYSNLKIAAKLMSSKFLHAEIREKGGAYGGGASINKGGHFMFYSYRDPNVTKTLKTFSSGIEWLLEESYSDRDINEAKLGVFSEVDAPVPPGSKGLAFFQEEISDEMKEEMRNNIFSCTRKDLIEVTKKYLQNPETVGTALIGPENEYTKSDDTSWNIVENKL
ncbi:presequence protease, mitochondrial [Nephila pilipes]|uniref:Presequence protease, mitochondrial n=1 Tax=Nephila pilipes TaxID=299642 RepID=A0A8X6N5L5_NEPPI|nr:presequence protease, mitochondrial [Nephila pilipes]